MARDFYQALGVSRDATPDQIQQAFRSLARKFHPDVNKDPGAEDRFKEINEAYHVLSDPETRKRYDRFGDDFRHVPDDWEEQARAGAGMGGQGGFRGAPGGGRVRYSTGGFGAGAGINIEDLFGDIFSGGGGFGPIPGADQEAELELTVEEAYRGGKRQISLGGRNYTVNIPAGVVDGQRIRLAGEGGRGRGDGPPGDLYLVVHIKPDKHFRLDGRDIVADLPLSPWEAVLGATVAVRTPGGEAKVKVPPARPPADDCGCAGRECPTRRENQATCSPKSRSWCRPNRLRGNGNCSSNWLWTPPSTRGGLDDGTPLCVGAAAGVVG